MASGCRSRQFLAHTRRATSTAACLQLNAFIERKREIAASVQHEELFVGAAAKEEVDIECEFAGPAMLDLAGLHLVCL